MQSATVTLGAQGAILLHAFPLMPIEAIEKKSPAEQAELAAYRDPKTQELYFPGINIQRAFVGGASYSKGKGRATLQKQVAACLLVTPERPSLGTSEYEIDSRPVVVPATKGRVIRHRPKISDWTITITVEWDENLLTAAQVRRVIDDTGTRVGLGDFRPEKKGPFGRFVVTHWTMNGGNGKKGRPAGAGEVEPV